MSERPRAVKVVQPPGEPVPVAIVSGGGTGSDVNIAAVGGVPVAGSVPVSATDFDIRDLAFATDKVDVSGSEIKTRSTVSTLNSTTTPLAGGATYTGTFEPTDGNVSIAVLVNSNSLAIADALKIDFSTDGVNVDRTINVDMATGGDFASFGAEAAYYRIRLTAGAGAQSFLRLQTRLLGTAEGPKYTPLIDTLTDSSSALLTRGVIFGKTTGMGDAYVAVKVNPSGALTVAASQDTTPWVVNDPGLPDTLGQKAATGSTSVVLASDQPAVPVQEASVAAISLQTSTSGDNPVVTPASGKSIRLYWWGLSADPGNSAKVTASLKFGVNPAFVSVPLSQYGGIFAHSYKGGRSYVQGGVDEALVLNLSTGQSTTINIDYEEV